MLWPPHALALTTPDLVLGVTTEADAVTLGEVIPADVPHDPKLPDVASGQKVLLKYWQSCGSWSTDTWRLWFTVLHEGDVIGVQALKGKDFAVMRSVETWSWLVQGARSRGFGKQMRAGVLSLAFTHLGAVRATSEAWEDNAASLGVSRALGYVDNGVDVRRRLPGDGVEVESAGRMQRLLLDAEGWRSPFAVTVAGVEDCLPLLGVAR